MINSFWFFAPLLAFIAMSCESKNENIPDVVDRIKDYSYDSLIGKSIYLRGRGDEYSGGMIYLSSLNNNCGPYIVQYNYEEQSIGEIDSSLAINSCRTNYFDIDEIVAAVDLFVDLDVRLIKVDLDTNIFVHTSKVEILDLIRTKEVPSVYEYELITDNWYIPSAQ